MLLYYQYTSTWKEIEYVDVLVCINKRKPVRVTGNHKSGAVYRKPMYKHHPHAISEDKTKCSSYFDEPLKGKSDRNRRTIFNRVLANLKLHA